MNDERTIKISEKASEKTILVFTIGSILYFFVSMGIMFSLREALISNGLQNIPWYLGQLPSTLLQAGIMIAILYGVFYVYYRVKYGGF